MKFNKVFSELFSNEFSLESEYIKQNIPITIKHKKCGYKFNILPQSVSRNKSCVCPKCNPSAIKHVIKGINDIATTNPELVHLFKNMEDAYKYKKWSTQYTWYICPCCGNEYYLQIQNVTKAGKVPCDICNDGFSYPNKFMANLLSQLNITYEKEYSPDWISPKKYDFYFQINNKNYIVEMDGGLGHGNSFGKPFQKDLDDGITIDKHKDKMAKNHGISVIRIDCNYTSKRFEYITNSILNSYLAELFDLNAIDFKKCDLASNDNIFRAVLIDLQNGIYDTKVLSRKHKLGESTIRNYINTAIESNIISQKAVNQYRFESRKKKISDSKNQKVLCIETNEIFDSYKDANKKYRAALSQYFNKNGKSSGKLPDGTKLTWKKLNEDIA